MGPTASRTVDHTGGGKPGGSSMLSSLRAFKLLELLES